MGAALAAGAAAVLWRPAFLVTPASAQAACPPPPRFPAALPLYQHAYRSWEGSLVVDPLWTTAPRTPADVVTLAEWARTERYTLRARGRMHNWSPLTVTPGTTCASKVVLVDTTRHLTRMQIVSAAPPAVRVQTGADMEALLAFLEGAGLGFTAMPAPGDLTVGGVIAIDGHGTGVPAQGEPRAGQAYGSVSNRILALEAVVWDSAAGRYTLRTFDRTHPDMRALLVNLGRAFVTEVTLRASPNLNLRCQSFVHIPAAEMFAAPPAGSGPGVGRTFASYVESAGRVEAIWFPFTDRPWLKVWSVRRTKPLFSRFVARPYNYPFSDTISPGVAGLLRRIVTGEPRLTPLFGRVQLDIVTAGLIATGSYDIWGPSKNLLLYVRPTTLRVHANGYAVVTRRDAVQRVIADFVSFYTDRVRAYRTAGLYPMNGPVEIRVTGLDVPGDVAGVAGPQVPTLSALAPRPDRPDWDAAVWLDILTCPGTPGMFEFYREVEDWVFRTYAGGYATVRPEWSKGWAYSTRAAWADPVNLARTVPDAHRAGRPVPNQWDLAVQRLDALDPHRVFTNPFLDALLR
jgi:FAD/FMN-containing dehydrogenase